jgi:hypothetical protein
MINANYESILKYVYENDANLEEIMKRLNKTSIDQKLYATRFLIDLFNCSKQHQSIAKEQFFTQLTKDELLSLLIEILTYNEPYIEPTSIRIEEEKDPEYNVSKLDLLKTHAAEILTNCLQILPSKVKS